MDLLVEENANLISWFRLIKFYTDVQEVFEESQGKDILPYSVLLR